VGKPDRIDAWSALNANGLRDVSRHLVTRAARVMVVKGTKPTPDEILTKGIGGMSALATIEKRRLQWFQHLHNQGRDSLRLLCAGKPPREAKELSERQISEWMILAGRRALSGNQELAERCTAELRLWERLARLVVERARELRAGAVDGNGHSHGSEREPRTYPRKCTVGKRHRAS